MAFVASSYIRRVFSCRADGSGAGDSLTTVLSRENIHEEPSALRHALETGGFGYRVKLFEDYGAASAIGTGINASYRNVLTGSAALRGAGNTFSRAGNLFLPHHLAGDTRAS